MNQRITSSSELRRRCGRRKVKSYCGGPEIVLQGAYLDDVTKEEVRHNCRRYPIVARQKKPAKKKGALPGGGGLPDPLYRGSIRSSRMIVTCVFAGICDPDYLRRPGPRPFLKIS